MKKLASPQDDYIRTAMRLPPDLHGAVKAAAREAGHTMNAEIIARVAGAEDRIALKMLVKQNEELRRLMLEMLERVELLR